MRIESSATVAGYAEFLFLENMGNMLLLAREIEKEIQIPGDQNRPRAAECVCMCVLFQITVSRLNRRRDTVGY